jgi:hypothetical protein
MASHPAGRVSTALRRRGHASGAAGLAPRGHCIRRNVRLRGASPYAVHGWRLTETRAQFDMLIRNMIAVLAWAIVATLLQPAAAQDKPYREGTVWSLSFVKVKPGMFDVYMRDVAPQRKLIMEEAKKQGLVLSYKVLSGNSANAADWDVLFMDEYKNWAAFDGLSDKFEAIEAKLIGNEDKRTQVMVKRTEVREIVGDKVMQELILK